MHQHPVIPMAPQHLFSQDNQNEVQHDFLLHNITRTSLAVTDTDGIVSGTITFFNIQMIKMSCNLTFLVMWCQWCQDQCHIIPMLSSMVYDTVVSTGTKSHNASKILSQHDKCKSVIDCTISILWQETCYWHACAKSKIPHMYHIGKLVQVHMRQLCQYICLTWSNCSRQCDLQH